MLCGKGRARFVIRKKKRKENESKAKVGEYSRHNMRKREKKGTM